MTFLCVCLVATCLLTGLAATIAEGQSRVRREPRCDCGKRASVTIVYSEGREHFCTDCARALVRVRQP